MARLNSARAAQHLSIRALGRIAGVPTATAQGWLNGRHLPTPALRPNFLRLVEHLGLAHELPPQFRGGAWNTLEPVLRRPCAPYLGLRPFGVTDAPYFHGRSSEARRLADSLAELRRRDGHGIVALVGPSGCGKSSLLAAGLVAGECTDGSLAGWSTSLATATSLPSDPTDLVVIDQFEDVLLAGPARDRILDQVAQLAARTMVAIGLRSDAFASASREPVLVEALSRPVLLSPLTREELCEVIVAPARLAGVTVEDDLVHVLQSDLAPGAGPVPPDVLPLLSNALLVTWAAGSGERMTLADYRAAGGAAYAVESLAEEVYASVPEAQQSAAKALLLKLVVVSDDAVARRSVPLSSLDPDAEAVTSAFISARMLTATDGVLRISHDALLVHWSRLREWIADSRADLAALARLRRAAEVWLDTDRDPASLIPVHRFSGYTEWLEDPASSVLLSGPEREYLAASRAHFATALDNEVATSRRLRRRGRAAMALAALGLALALVSSYLYALGRDYQDQAIAARGQAESRQIATTAGTVRGQDPNLQAQMAVVARTLAVTRESTSALLDATSVAVPTRWLGAPGARLATDGAGAVVALGDGTGSVTVWDGPPAAGDPGTTFAAIRGPVGGLAIGRSGARVLLAAAGPEQVRLWDVTGVPVALADLDRGGLDPTSSVTVAFSPRGDRLALATTAGVELWSLRSGRPSSSRRFDVVRRGSSLPVTAVALDDTHLYAGVEGRIARWRLGDPGGPKRLEDLTLPGDRPRPYQFALGSGGRLAAAMANKRVLQWRVEGDAAVGAPTLHGFDDWATAVAYSGDGRRLVAGGADQVTRLFETDTGTLVRTLPGPAPLTGVAFSGNRPLTTDSDGTLRAWPDDDPLWRSGGSELYNLSTDAGARTWLAGGTPADGIQLWRLGGSATRMPTPANGLPAGTQSGAVAVAPDGRFLLGATFDGRVLSWPLGEAGAGTVSAVDVGLGYISFVQVAPDSRLVVAMGYLGDSCALLLADPDGRLRQVATVPTPDPQMVWFSADSRTLAVALPDRRVVLWDVAEPARPRVAGEVAGLDSTPISIAFAPTSATLAVGTSSGRVSVWDVASASSPRMTAEFGDPHAAPNCVLFSPDESLLVATSGDQRIWGWDLTDPDADEALFSLAGDLGRPWDARFLSDGRLAVSGGNGAMRVWDLDPAAATEQLCRARGDALAADEWSRYLPGVTPREPCAVR